MPNIYEFNGHYYEYVEVSSLTWEQAKTLSESRSYQGAQGYLATVTSIEERNFIDQVIFGSDKPDNIFVGGSDANAEGIWRWVTGPEGKENNGLGRIFFDAATQTNYTNIPTNDLWIGGASPSQDSPDADYLYMYSWSDPSFNPWNNVTGSLGAGGNGGFLVEYSPELLSDKLVLDKIIFTRFTNTVRDSNLIIGTDAQDSDDYLIYDSNTQTLYYDADGNSVGAKVAFAQLIGVNSLSSADFSII